MSVTVTIGEDVYRDVMGIRGEFEDFEDVIVRLLDGLETVGGDVDVAIITKGDGFIWTKRTLS